MRWFLALFGALWAVSNAQDIDSIAETRHWPAAHGTIVASNIASEVVGTYIGKYSSHSMHMSRLHLTYTFDVDGHPYTGSRWNALPPSSSLATQANLRRYAPGREVIVHYDPRDPGSAVIDTAWPIDRCAQLACALLILIVSLVGVFRRRLTSGGRAQRSSSAATRGA